MRILLVNYTGDQPNPGCRATTNGLKNLLNASDASTIDTLPMAYLADIMALPLSSDKDKGLSLLQRARNRIKKSSLLIPLIKIHRLITKNFLYLRQRQLSTWEKPQKSPCSLVTNLQLDRWISAVKQIRSTEHVLVQRIKLADKIVVSGEGTFHHNQHTDLSALPFARVARLIGKDVHMIMRVFVWFPAAALSADITSQK